MTLILTPKYTLYIICCLLLLAETVIPFTEITRANFNFNQTANPRRKIINMSMTKMRLTSHRSTDIHTVKSTRYESLGLTPIAPWPDGKGQTSQYTDKVYNYLTSMS